MGRKSRLKKDRRLAPGKNQAIIDDQAKLKPAPMDPVLIEAYVKGRTVGEQQGRAQGIEEAVMLYAEWIDTIDEVKGVGPQIKENIFQYLNDKMRAYLNLEEGKNE